MSALNKLISYRERYLRRADDKIQPEYLSMLDDTIQELQEMSERINGNEKLIRILKHLFHNLNYCRGHSIEEFTGLPDNVFEKVILLSADKKISEQIEIFRTHLEWEKRLQNTVDDLRAYKEWSDDLKKLWKDMLPLKDKELYNMADYYTLEDIEEILRTRYMNFLEKRYI